MARRPSCIQLLNSEDFNRMDFASMESIQLAGASGYALPDHFLQRYTSSEMESLLARTDFPNYLRAKNYINTHSMVSCDPSGISTFRIYRDSMSPVNLLIDLRVSEKRFYPPSFRNQLKTVVYDMVLIEWFLSRDPSSSFHDYKKRLPGQDHPGLGALSSFFRLMVIIGGEIPRDGFMAVPDRLHAAMMYASTFFFLEPVQEGTIRALRRDLRAFSLSDIAWAHVTGAIRDVLTGESFIYQPSLQVYPVSGRMRRYFHSAVYMSAMREANGGHSFVLDRMVLEKGRKAAMDEDLRNL